MLPAILAAKTAGFTILYLPPLDDFLLQQIEGLVFRFVETLQEVIESFSGQLSAFSTTLSSPSPPSTASVHQKDFKHILGHQQVKKALEIAAAGGHNVMMTGPPGCGKSLLAETFPSILLYLSHEHQFEVVSIYQLAGVEKPHLGLPPFRHPHHSASAVSLIGGGSNPKPGESRQVP